MSEVPIAGVVVFLGVHCNEGLSVPACIRACMGTPLNKKPPVPRTLQYRYS
jgi:hypothetical protein